jgi:hypothetical protein
MPMAPFHWRFGELALREMRLIEVRGSKDLPDGEYTLVESYCSEPGCDCRRVLLQIFTRDNSQPLAFVSYGWAPREFYAQRCGGDDFDYCGPYLEPMAGQSAQAQALLELVRVALSDPDYVEQLKRHYAMFRQGEKANLGKRAGGGQREPKKAAPVAHALKLEIPAEFARSFGETEDEVRRNAKEVLAVAMYRQGSWPLETAIQFAGVTREQFAEVLRRRKFNEAELTNLKKP